MELKSRVGYKKEFVNKIRKGKGKKGNEQKRILNQKNEKRN